MLKTAAPAHRSLSGFRRRSVGVGEDCGTAAADRSNSTRVLQKASRLVKSRPSLQ